MLVADAGCLVEVVVGTERAAAVAAHLLADDDQVAPHVVDAEVFGVIRKYHELGRIDDTAARQAIEDLRDWPGERLGHRPLLERSWQLRANVRGSDALYVALAEATEATLLTTDARLSRAPGPTCRVVVV